MNFVRLISMSLPKAVVEKKLMDGRSEQFARHLAKIVLMPRSTRINHWTKELFNLCYWIQDIRMKPDNKRVTRQMMDDFFFGTCNDAVSFKCNLDRIRSEYNLSKQDTYDNEIFSTKITPFLDELENSLCSDSQFTLNDMKVLINKFILTNKRSIYD